MGYDLAVKMLALADVLAAIGYTFWHKKDQQQRGYGNVNIPGSVAACI